ncbi:MAG: hypothetical protein HKP03_06840 [Xanthomonadales bacterium]|nr:hypothetical protein [Gammaproteobacteria bacterium]NNK38179.1 hypothetical protein [Xanthomonadales bacterium]
MHLNSRFSQWSLLTSVAAVALVTLALGWPRLLASIRFLPVERAIAEYHAEREIPSHRMQTLAGFAHEAIDLHDHYRYHDGLSFLQYLRGLDIYTPARERRDAYRQAEAAAIETVRRAPAQPEAWLRIATVRAVLRDEPGDVLEPWRMSVFTGRTHSTLLAPRVGLALPYVEFMDGETRSMLRDQLLLAWQLKPRELAAEFRQRDPGLDRTRVLIDETDPEALSEMEAQLEKAR